jgi:glycosyltransferase involved in cell wall biosynthesis
MKIYYWCPFISEVATVKATINSIDSINKFSKKNIDLKIINVFGEWNEKLSFLNRLKISCIQLYNFDFKNFLPLGSYFKSRFSYVLIFLYSFFKLHKLIKKDEPNYLICHLITSLPLLLLFIFSYKTKFILRISGFPKLNFFRKLLWIAVSNKIFIVTCPTKDCLKLVQSKNIFPSSKLIYLPDPIIDFDEIRKKKFDNITIEKNFNKSNSLVSIGRLTKQKNFEFLINCFEKISLKYPHLNLFIIGDGEEKRNLQNQINNLQLNDKVFLLGYKKNVYRYLRSCYCFILSSLWEDPGFVLI